MNVQPIAQWYGHDHDRLDELFQQFRASKETDFPRAGESFRQFRKGLEQHIAWEEGILFPLFEEKTGLHGCGPTEVMRQEHREIKRLLEQIGGKIERNDAATDADGAALLQTLGAHNEKEENILYPAIDELLGDAEHQDVYGRMETVKG
ncbi:MAG: hemerythrin domain-containing protein [Verrucomicrobia bacterium]|nr:hemerythrin domain-containing protein [Verrucomicrobiota bacterium]